MKQNNSSIDPEILIQLARMRMPFGRYKDRLLCDLPEPYLVWFQLLSPQLSSIGITTGGNSSKVWPHLPYLINKHELVGWVGRHDGSIFQFTPTVQLAAGPVDTLLGLIGFQELRHLFGQFAPGKGRDLGMTLNPPAKG